MVNLKHFKCDGVTYVCGEEYKGPSARLDELKAKKLVGSQAELDERDQKSKVTNLQLVAHRKREKTLIETHGTQSKGKDGKKKKVEALADEKPKRGRKPRAG